MIFPEKIAHWCRPGVAPALKGASATEGSVPTMGPGLLFGVRALVGGRATLLKGFGERFCCLLRLELREPLQLPVLACLCCSSGLFGGTLSLVSLPRTVEFDLLVILVELGLVLLFSIAFVGRSFLGTILVGLRGCASGLSSDAQPRPRGPAVRRRAPPPAAI